MGKIRARLAMLTLSTAMLLVPGNGQALANGTARSYPPASLAPATLPIPGQGVSPLFASAGACQWRINDPHGSTHVPGTVNVTGSVTCTSAIPYIAINVALYRNGSL